MKIALWAVAASGCLLLLVGCGLAANPQPPTLWLPEPVKNLTALREGDEVHLHWSMPRDSTDKLKLKGPQRAHFCWMASGNLRFDAKICAGSGDAEFAPDKPADFTTRIPPGLSTGNARAMSYFVELQNHAGKSAGPSNAAWIATGPPPPAVAGLRLEAQSRGVVLRWQPSASEPSLVLRIHRMLVMQPGMPKAGESNGAPPPEQQTLEVDLDKADSGEALDRDAPLNHIWRYTAERVLRVEADHRALEVGGRSDGPVTIDAKDIFPPAVPSGLAAVADEQAHAIDISWAPDSDTDVAGYIVYRRDVTAGTGQQRISPKTLVVPPSFEDTQVQAGHRYAYSVSAVDQDGNESARSGEAEEELPQ